MVDNVILKGGPRFTGGAFSTARQTELSKAARSAGGRVPSQVKIGGAKFNPITGVLTTESGEQFSVKDIEGAKAILRQQSTPRQKEEPIDTRMSKIPESPKAIIPTGLPPAVIQTGTEFQPLQSLFPTQETRRAELIQPPTFQERQQEIRKREAKRTFEEATPIEQQLLTAQTFLSEKGFEAIASFPGAFVGGRELKDITIENIARQQLIKGEAERQQFILESAIFNPPVVVGSLFLGGAGLGAVATQFPKVALALGSTPGKIALGGVTASFLGVRGVETLGEVQAGRPTSAIATVIQTGTEVFSIGKGFQAGQSLIAERILIQSVGKVPLAVAKGLKGTKSEFITEPELVPIRKLKPFEEVREPVFKVLKQGEIFGSVSKESQLLPALRKSASDIDVASRDTADITRKLNIFLGKKVKDVFDIKPQSKLEEFLVRQRPQTTPGGQKTTTLSEESFRSLFASEARGGRSGRQGIKDIESFQRSIETLIASKSIQIQRSRLPFKESRLKNLEEIERSFQSFVKAEVKLSEIKPGTGAKRPPIKEIEFVESSPLGPTSKLPSGLGKPSALSSRVPSITSGVRGVSSSLLQPPSKLPPSVLPPSILPPSILPPKPPPPKPPSRLPSRSPSILPSSKLPPSILPPSILPPKPPPPKPPSRPPKIFNGKKRVRIFKLKGFKLGKVSKKQISLKPTPGRFQAKKVGLSDLVFATTKGEKRKTAGFFRVGRKSSRRLL